MNNTKNNTALLAIIIISLIPAIMWSKIMPLSIRFEEASQIFKSISQLSGLIGMVLFSLALILSARLKFLDKLFGGLDKMYLSHHSIGIVATTLLLIHPVSALLKWFIGRDFSESIKIILSTWSWVTTVGLISLLLMASLIFITIFVKIPYQKWKVTHKFMGLAFFFGVLHTFFVGSDLAQSAPLKIYILTLAFLALCAHTYRTLLGKKAVKKYQYEITKVANIGDITEVTLKPINNADKMQFTAGQFAFISFISESLGTETHPFSMSSGPQEEKLRFSIKNLGDYTSQISNLRVGEKALIEGAYGALSYKTCAHKKQIWLAGGIGITPFLSMAKSLNESSGYDINLFYCSNNEKEAVYLDELNSIATRTDQLNLVSFCSDTQGFITAEKISELSNGLTEKSIVLCGPPRMMEALQAQLIAKGVSPEHIHFEKFNLV